MDDHAAPTRVRVHPGRLAGDVEVPGDKSISHRALILAAMCDGPVEITGLAGGSDVLATVRALRTMGARIELTREGQRSSSPKGGSAPDHGFSAAVSGALGEASDVLDLGNSGTGMRLLAGVAAGIDGCSVLTGDASLRRRPMERIADPLRRMGARVDGREGGRLPPLVVRGGALRGTRHRTQVASAQVKSCLLLAGLRARGATDVTSPGASRDHTERLLAHLGVDVRRTIGADGEEHVHVVPGPLEATTLQVAGDPSSAAFWMVAAAPAPGGAALRARGIALNPTRLGAVSVLRSLGAAVEIDAKATRCGEPVGDVRVSPAPLGGAEVGGGDVVHTIDELPVLAVAGACSRDGLDVRDAAELRVKESDRIATLTALFEALGLRIQPRPDGFRVPGGQQPSGGAVDAQNDHRIAMTACIAATFAAGPVDIAGFQGVATSYPTFLDDFERLGGRAEVLEGA